MGLRGPRVATNPRGATSLLGRLPERRATRPAALAQKEEVAKRPPLFDRRERRYGVYDSTKVNRRERRYGVYDSTKVNREVKK